MLPDRDRLSNHEQRVPEEDDSMPTAITRMAVFAAVAGLCLIDTARPDDPPLLKAGYLPVSAKLGITASMRDAGLNAVWLKLTSFAPDGDDYRVRQRLEAWNSACAKQQLQLWPAINFAGGPNELKISLDFRREVTPAGLTLPRTPCPVDEAYWRTVIFSRCVKLAEWSRSLPQLVGVVLDLEMYGADHAGYTTACACAECRRGAGSSQTAALLDWQRREVARIARDLERAVHAVAPRFQFAAMHLDEPFAFHEGLALGLGTPDVPVVIASERTYAGVTDEIAETRQRFQRLQASVRFVGGLSLTHHRADQVAPQLYALGSHGDGFWLYSLASLAAEPRDIPETYRVADPQPEFWSAIRRASAELDRWQVSRGQYVSPLRKELVLPDARATLAKRVLEPVSQPLPRLPLEGRETQLRRANSLLMLLERGERLRVQVRGVPVSKQTTGGEVSVLDPEGREVLTVAVPLGESREIDWVAASAGTHTLITRFGRNGCELRVANPRAVFLASLHQRLKVHQFVRPLYFVVGEANTAEITVLTESPDESVHVRVHDASGQAVVDRVVWGSQVLSAKGTAGVWSLSLAGIEGRAMGSVQIGLSPPLAPYLADAPERLLRDKR